MSARLTIAALILLCTACAPHSAPVAAEPQGRPSYRATLSAVDADACRRSGGEVRRVCKLQNERCIRTFADAGKTCTDNDQCEGRCLADGPAEPGIAVVGRCQKTSDPCGCFIDVRNGKAGSGLCID